MTKNHYRVNSDNPALYRTLDKLIWAAQGKTAILNRIQQTQHIQPYSLLDNLIHVTLDYLTIEYRQALEAMAKGGPSARILPAQSDEQTAIQCLRCGRVSYNANDIANAFCSFCKVFREHVITVA